MKSERRFLSNAAALLGLLALAGPALALDGPETEFTPKDFSLIDGNGIDLVERSLNVGHSISIGDPANGGMSYSVSYSSAGTWKFYQSTMAYARLDIISDGDLGYEHWEWTLAFQGQMEKMDLGPSETNMMGDLGSHMSVTSSASGLNISATLADGTALAFDPTWLNVSETGTIFRLTSAVRPNGERLDFHYVSGGLAIRSITNNHGYQLRYVTPANSPAPLPAPTSVVLFNMAVDACDPDAATCPAFSRTWPRLTFEYGAGSNVSAVIETGGERTQYAYGTGPKAFLVQAIDGPGTRDTAVTYENCGNDWPNGNCAAGQIGKFGGYRVTTITKGGTTTTYTWVPALVHDEYERGTRVSTSIGSIGYVFRAYLSPLAIARVIDQLGRVTQMEHFAGSSLNAKLTKVTYPEGNSVQYTYDQRFNLSSVTRSPKPGSTLASTVITLTRGEAGNTLDCIRPAYCNKVVLIRDARQFVRRFVWDQTTGALLSTEAGLQGPDNNLVCSFGSNLCPKTDYSYSSVNAYFLNASGQLAAAPPILLQTASTQCEDIANCSTAQQVVTTTGYGTPGVANNLLVRSVSVGKGGVTHTTTFAYDEVGNRTQTDGPRTDVADITKTSFDLNRRPTLVVAADSSAKRATYSTEGYVATVELGTSSGSGQFTPIEITSNSYDSGGRLIKAVTPVGVTQMSYDALGRLTCTAVRMNPAMFASLPASACNLSQAGANGPDRITRNIYDAADEIVRIQHAYGTSLQQDYATIAYNLNGTKDWVQDANGNRSDYEYDGFDRLSRLYFPATIVGSHARNDADFEEYGYDSNDNHSSTKLRSGETIGFIYDALNRESIKDFPNGTSLDVYSGYDLMGRVKWKRYQSTAGFGIDYAYDAWGGILSEVSFGQVLSFQNDEAENRTRITWPDTNYVQYTYDVMNRMDQVRENGASAGPQLLADYYYDSLGRRGGIALGNATTTTFAYDGGSRLSGMRQDLVGAQQDLNIGLTYNNANQIITRLFSNEIYHYAPLAPLLQAYDADGLNRYSSVGGVLFTYDARQNLTDSGDQSFEYDLENRLTRVSATGGAPTQLTLTYDPRGRLRQTFGSTTTTFLYAGDQLVAEYDGDGLMQQRYVPGAGVDETLASYSGSAMSAETRRWLHLNHQGSVVGVSDGNGSLSGPAYSYSSYGEPDSLHGWTGSRIRFTGQIALPEVQLYHYKARVYSPKLGRFLQTDPIGYEDDLNSYAYVYNDPVNSIDPTGNGKIPLRKLIDGGFRIRNVALANKLHPVTKIPFNGMGFPIFNSVAIKTVYLKGGFKGAADEIAANARAGLKETPKGYSWHHHEDGRTMQLVPSDIHAATGHTGGMATTAAAQAEELIDSIDPSTIAGLASLSLGLLLYSDGAPTDPCHMGDLRCDYKGPYSDGAGPQDPDTSDIATQSNSQRSVWPFNIDCGPSINSPCNRLSR